MVQPDLRLTNLAARVSFSKQGPEGRIRLAPRVEVMQWCELVHCRNAILAELATVSRQQGNNRCVCVPSAFKLHYTSANRSRRRIAHNIGRVHVTVPPNLFRASEIWSIVSLCFIWALLPPPEFEGVASSSDDRPTAVSYMMHVQSGSLDTSQCSSSCFQDYAAANFNGL